MSSNMYACAGHSYSCLVRDEELYFTGKLYPQLQEHEQHKGIGRVRLNSIVQICGGGMHLLALMESGQAMGFGSNEEYQLGIAETQSDTVEDAFGHLYHGRPLTCSVRIAKIAAGGAHTIALGIDGRVYTCGKNRYGSLGVGDTAPRQTLTLVESEEMSGVGLIAAGQNHSLALDEHNHVYAWGRNQYHQCGESTDRRLVSPTRVCSIASTDTVTQLLGGENHSLYLTNKGKVFVWGHNKYGQQGNNLREDITYPTQVALPDDVRLLACGGDHVIVLLIDNVRVYGWGYNKFGQLGQQPSTTTCFVRSPITIKLDAMDMTPVASIAAGGDHSIIVSEAGHMYTFGLNSVAQLGFETPSDERVDCFTPPFSPCPYRVLL